MEAIFDLRHSQLTELSNLKTRIAIYIIGYFFQSFVSEIPFNDDKRREIGLLHCLLYIEGGNCGQVVTTYLSYLLSRLLDILSGCLT